MIDDLRELKAALQEATQQILDLVEQRIDFEWFAERYDNFYYRAGIDGFDCSDEQREWLKTVPEAIELHRIVQELINRSYSNAQGSEEAYRLAARLSADETRTEIVSATRTIDLRSMLLALQSA